MPEHCTLCSKPALNALYAALLLSAAMITGCGYPVAEPANMELISSLRTALSAQNEEWLKANEDRIEERHANGAMRDDEYAAFAEIIRMARSGKWQEAEAAAVDFQKAQRPTDEQIQRLRQQAQ